LLVVVFLLMLIVVIPVFAIVFWVAWRYNENHSRDDNYKPDWGGSKILEVIWWVIPSALILVLGIMTWNSSHQYDPYKKLPGKQLNVQVVAMDWRWLFIYPDQHVASINKLYMPVNRPVSFTITADAPMNSFWIPRLGGQIYAMPGMSTQLNLEASKIGTYYGSSANISGQGFSDMHFTAQAVSSDDFTKWVHQAQKQSALTNVKYDELAKPIASSAVETFSAPADGLYDTIVAKYMGMDMSGMDMNMEGM